MFQQRQMNEVWPLVEESFSTATVAPGAITNGSLATASTAFTLGSPGGGGTSAATFALGDTLEVIAPALAALNGVACTAYPTATAGTALIVFLNNTGGTVTPVAAIYKIIAKRQVANVVV
jgi:hypothetical protein